MFEYSFDFGNNEFVSGTFNGTANGNLVTELSNITANYNGVALNGGGSLFNASFDVNLFAWKEDNGFASFDGSANNFIFVDSHIPLDLSYKSGFASVSNLGLSWVFNEQNPLSTTSTNFSQWHLAEVNPVPEPETLAMILLGLPMMAWAGRRRKAA